MAGRKQHFIQRLLLKGFSFDPSREPCHIWVYRKDGNCFAPALEGYGAERDFYGDPSASELDSRITDIESGRFDDFLDQLRHEPDSPVDAGRSTEFVVHVLLRSKNIRSMFVAGVEPLMARVMERLKVGDTLERLILSALRDDPTLLQSKLDSLGLPPPGTAELRERLAPILPILVKRILKQQKSALDSFLDGFQSKVAQLVADAQRKTLQDRLHDFSGARAEQLRTLDWQTKTVQGDLILGDSVVFAELSANTFKPFTEPGDSLSKVWLPFSSDRVLVGSPRGETITVDPSRVNIGAASCSFDAFCASKGPDFHSSLVSHIRTSTFSLDDSANEQVANEVLEKLIK